MDLIGLEEAETFKKESMN